MDTSPHDGIIIYITTDLKYAYSLTPLPHMKRLVLCNLCWILFAAPLAARQTVDYTSDVKPLLKKHCINCHGPEKPKGGLCLDAVALAKQGGDSGPAIVPGSSKQ